MNKLDRIRAAVSRAPNDPFGWYSLAMELRKTDSEEALGVFRKLETEFATYVPAYFQHGTLLAGLERREEAKRVFTLGIERAHAANDAHTAHEIAAALEAL